MEALQHNVIKDSRIKLRASVESLSKEFVPVAEALVAFDPRTDTIVKFVAAFIPPFKGATHQGVKYLISKYPNGEHKPVVIHHTGKKKEGTYWNPYFHTAFLDYSKLPMTNEYAEFRVLRAYRSGIRAPSRFEILAFHAPEAGKDVNVDKDLYVEYPFNSVPPIYLTYCHGDLFWWQKKIVNDIGLFSGVDLGEALGLGIKRKLQKAVNLGTISENIVEDILHDHSEDTPTDTYESIAEAAVSESIAESFGVSNNTEHDVEEDRDHEVPVNPLLMDAKEEDEELVDLYD
jgi:hypothetical protein